MKFLTFNKSSQAQLKDPDLRAAFQNQSVTKYSLQKAREVPREILARILLSLSVIWTDRPDHLNLLQKLTPKNPKGNYNHRSSQLPQSTKIN
jgi:hypothetical protein